jgi:hypothetical protein
VLGNQGYFLCGLCHGLTCDKRWWSCLR